MYLYLHCAHVIALVCVHTVSRFVCQNLRVRACAFVCARFSALFTILLSVFRDFIIFSVAAKTSALNSKRTPFLKDERLPGQRERLPCWLPPLDVCLGASLGARGSAGQTASLAARQNLPATLNRRRARPAARSVEGGESTHARSGGKQLPFITDRGTGTRDEHLLSRPVCLATDSCVKPPRPAPCLLEIPVMASDSKLLLLSLTCAKPLLLLCFW